MMNKHDAMSAFIEVYKVLQCLTQIKLMGFWDACITAYAHPTLGFIF